VRDAEAVSMTTSAYCCQPSLLSRSSELPMALTAKRQQRLTFKTKPSRIIVTVVIKKVPIKAATHTSELVGVSNPGYEPKKSCELVANKSRTSWKLVRN